MKVLVYNLAFIFSLLSVNSFAQFEATKTIEQSFSMSNSSELNLENKYGDVIIDGWDKDSISIKMDILVRKKSSYDAQDLLDRIEMDYTAAGRYISIKTQIQDKQGSFFEKLFNEITTELDKSDVNIDYTISLPSSARIEVYNSFGDIIISNCTGRLKTELKHGDLKITDPMEEVNMKVSFGKIGIRSAEELNASLRNSKLKLTSSDDVRLDSNGSEIEFGEIKSLDLISNKDDIRIRDVDRFKAKVRYSNIMCDQLNQDLFLELHIADVRISKITNPACPISIQENNSDVDINVSGISLEVEADLEGGTFRLPSSTQNIDTMLLDEKDNHRQVTANYGSGESGKFILKGKKGYIILREIN